MSHEGAVLEFSLSSEKRVSNTLSEFTMENEFYYLLHNRKLLSLFKDFCLSKTVVQDLLFWMDVEVLRNVSDDSIALMGKYIFATYIADHAPMKVNIPNEIKVEVVRLAKSSSHATAFDEAQFLVFDALKSILFPRFKETAEYLATNSQDFGVYKISTPYAVFFPPDKSLFTEICEQHEKYSELEMPLYLKEVLLNQVINRFFPEAEPTLDYFETIQAMDRQHRSLKLQREKKLKKFFGVNDPMACEVLASHIQTSPTSITFKLNTLLTPKLIEGPSAILYGIDGESTTQTPNVFQKKKRADKLESFFGVKPDPLTASESTPSIGKLQLLTKTSSLPSLVNQNEIPADVKQTLTRRSRKIRQMLGDGVESDLNALILESTKPGNIIRRYTTSNAHDPGTITNIAQAEQTLELESRITEEVSDSLDIGGQLDQFLAETSSKKKKDLSEEGEDNEFYTGDTKVAKLKRREKLQQLLGQGNLPAATTPANVNTVPLRHASILQSEQARRIRRKQSVKIEKLLGEVPSNFKLSDTDRKTLAHQHFIDTISMMLQRKDGISRIMNYIVQDQTVDKKPPPPPSMIYTNLEPSLSKEFDTQSNISLPTLDDDEKVQRRKILRQKKFNKLSKFFGGAVDPELLIEQRILSELEKKIEHDLQENDDSLLVLKGNLQALREQVKCVVDEMSEDELAIPSTASPPTNFAGCPEIPSYQPS